MFKKIFKLNESQNIEFYCDEDNDMGLQMIECFNKSIPFIPKNKIDIESKLFWQTVLENEIGNKNCTYIIDNIADNIITPIEIDILKMRNYPITLENIIKYICKEITNGRVDDWNDTNNLRIRTSEIFISLIQKQIYSAYTEYINKKLSGDVDAKLFINPTAVLSNVINSQNVQSLENINPLEELAMMTKVSPVGVGGIAKTDNWPQEAMNIHYSYYGNIDPLESPDSDKMGIIQHLSIGSAITNTRGLFTNRDHKSIKGSEILSIGPSLIPFANSNDGIRVVMGSGQSKQAIPLKNPNIPAVQTGFESIYTNYLSDFFIKRSPIDGTIIKINNLEIIIEDKDLNKHAVDIKPLEIKSGQGKSGLSVFKPLIKVGDKVKLNDIIAEGANVKNGTISNGINMLCAFMPWKGYNFEDGMVISESAAKKFISVHVETKETYIQEDEDVAHIVNMGDVVKKGDILLTFSQTIYDSETLTHLRAEPGKVVSIEIYSNLTEEEIPEKILPIYKEFRSRYELLHGVYPIGHFKEKNKKFNGILIKFTIQQELGLRIGDKLNNRSFNKGVTSCYAATTYVFTNDGWKLFKDIDPLHDLVGYMKDDGSAGFTKIDKYYEADYTGDMYGYKHTYGMNYLTTPNHRHYFKDNDSTDFTIQNAEDIYGKKGFVKTRFNYTDFPKHDDNEIFTLEKQDDDRSYRTTKISFNKYDWYEFFGWWVTEGCAYDQKNNKNRVIITQKKKEHLDTITNFLQRMGFNWCKSTNDHNYVITDDILYDYFSKFGKSYDKYIPDEMFHTSRENLQILFDSMLKGDGSFRKVNEYGFFTTSKRLMNDFIRLSLLLGYRTGKIMTDTLNRVRPKYIVYVKTDPTQIEEQRLFSTGHYIKPYNDKVYCVSIKNQLLFVKNENSVPFWSGNTIVPDNEMPLLPDGRKIEMIYATLSVLNRMNSGQLMEMHCGMISKELAKIAVSKPRKEFISKFNTVLTFLDGTKNKMYSKYTISKLTSLNDIKYKQMIDEIREETFVPLIFPPFMVPKAPDIIKALESIGLKTKYKLKIPEYNKTTQPVGVGYLYVMKLEHISEKKINSRATGPYNSITMTPTQGKKRGGGQKIGEYDLYSLLAWDTPVLIDELFGPVSTDHKVKHEMISEIVQTGETGFKVSESNPINSMFSQLMTAIMLKDEILK